MTDYLVVRDAPQMSRSDLREIPHSARGLIALVHRRTVLWEAPDSATNPSMATAPVGNISTYAYPQELSGDGGETDSEAQEHHPVRAVSHGAN